MPQSKPVALVLMLAALVDLLTGIYFFVFHDDFGVIVGAVCVFSAAVLFFLGLAFMPGKPGTSSPSRHDDWGPSHSDWDSTD